MTSHHKPQPPRSAPHAIALAVLALGSAGAQAQQAAAADTSTVVVTGIRAALESALNAKKQDKGIVDVIKAEDIAKFPDTNLAESLQRIPGVVIDRDAGEGRNITVRGLGADFTRVRINGIEALATTGGTDSSGGANRSRGFDFNVFAAELFNAITVRKSASADVDEGSLGATVDLQTARPLDFKTGLTATASLQGRFNDLSRSTDPRAAFLVANTFAGRRLGALFSGAYSKRKLFEEGFSTVRWDNGASSGGWCAPTGATANPSNSTATTCGPAAQNVPRLTGTPDTIAAYDAARSSSNYHPRLPRYGRLTHEQERLGLTGSVQFKPADGSLLTLDLMYAKLDATRQEDFLQAISFSRALSGGGKPQTSVVDTAYGSNGALLHGTYNGVDIRAESRFDELSTTFTQPTLTFEQEIGETLKLTARAGRAESKFRNPIQTTTTLDATNVNGYGLDFRGSDRLPAVTYPFDVSRRDGALTLMTVPVATSGTQANTVANTTSSEIRIRPQGADNRNDLLHVDLAWDAVPEKLTLRGGFDHKKYTFSTYEFRRVNQNDTIFAPAAGTALASLTTTLAGFGRGLNLPAGTPTSWVIPDLNAIANAYDIYCNCLKSGPAGGPGDFTLSSITNGNARGNNRRVVETDQGGFLMADFDTRVAGMPLRGNAGVRYVQTKQVATGYLATGGGTEVSVEQTYSDVLPSLNLAATVARDFIVRAAAAKVMSRPQLGNLNPGGTISTTGTLSITSGNPLLKPFRRGRVPQGHRHLHPEPAHQHRVQPDRPADVAVAGQLHRRGSVPGHHANQHPGGQAQRLRDQLAAAVHLPARRPEERRPAAQLHPGEIEDRLPGVTHQRHDDHRRPAQHVAAFVQRHGVLRRRHLQRPAVGLVPIGLPHPRSRAEQQRRRRQERDAQRGSVAQLQGQRSPDRDAGGPEPDQRGQ
jgi:TonB-dependent receptor